MDVVHDLVNTGAHVVLLVSSDLARQLRPEQFKALALSAPNIIFILTPSKRRRSAEETALIDVLGQLDILAIDLSRQADGFPLGAAKAVARLHGLSLGRVWDRQSKRDRRRIVTSLGTIAVSIGLIVSAVFLTLQAQVSTMAALEGTLRLTQVEVQNTQELVAFAAQSGPASQRAVSLVSARAETLDSAVAGIEAQFPDTAPILRYLADRLESEAFAARGEWDLALATHEQALRRFDQMSSEGLQTLGIEVNEIVFDASLHQARLLALSGDRPAASAIYSDLDPFSVRSLLSAKYMLFLMDFVTSNLLEVPPDSIDDIESALLKLGTDGDDEQISSWSPALMRGTYYLAIRDHPRAELELERAAEIYRKKLDAGNGFTSTRLALAETYRRQALLDYWQGGDGLAYARRRMAVLESGLENDPDHRLFLAGMGAAKAQYSAFLAATGMCEEASTYHAEGRVLLERAIGSMQRALAWERTLSTIGQFECSAKPGP
ncbi:MAG: hypothetical protein MRY64_06535 [Hyphomonadaceae bacterium]|nr:hypothetical protein [Hyphomonadaceae bacterium]